ncbi:MAG: branched-chain amino acid transaminase [Candidatus Micrarchaeaceae archaeon]
MKEVIKKVWLDGEIVDYDKANVSILTHSMQYGSGIFEGIRAYNTKKGPAIFRIDDHIQRFFNSAKIYSMKLGFSKDEIKKAIEEVIRVNNLSDCYIRPFAFYNDDSIGVAAYGKKVSVYIAAIPFGAYFSQRDLGIKCKVSSWHRISSEILPVKAKASGNYLNSIIASNEAKACGFDEAILISADGNVAEGPGENIFFVEDNKLITPDESADILKGITRSTIIEIAEDKGIEVEERQVKRDELYLADELFFSGTAAEITPIVNVDGIAISKGMGPITKILSDSYFDIVHGNNPEFLYWLDFNV